MLNNDQFAQIYYKKMERSMDLDQANKNLRNVVRENTLNNNRRYNR